MTEKVTSGVDKKGNPLVWTMDGYLKNTLDEAKRRVEKKGHDYVAVVAGLPSSGKSQFAQGACKYLCSWFDENYIAFSGEQFVDLCNTAPEFSAIILDESFQSLNTRTTMTPEFQKIINHLQLIRQKHLYIFFCLPNYFDLAKGIAIFRTHHLYVTYTDSWGDRGPFMAFDRDAKRNLYVKGQKFMDYNAHPANFYGRFALSHCIDENIYDKMKKKHLIEQGSEETVSDKQKIGRNNLVFYLFDELKLKTDQISDISGLNIRLVQRILQEERKNRGKEPKTGQKVPLLRVYPKTTRPYI